MSSAVSRCHRCDCRQHPGHCSSDQLVGAQCGNRGGEGGQPWPGFAVVADEVRNLSRQAADSSAQIRQIATGLKQSAEQARQGLQQLSGSTRLGLKKAGVVLGSMDEIQNGAVARWEVVERVLARLAGLHDLASQVKRMIV